MTRELLPAGRRELTRAHVAFYRAVLEGVDLARSWNQYLTADGDYTAVLAKATTIWVREALAHEARATGQHELIGLFRRDPWLVKASVKPTVAEFAARFEHGDEFSETELLELWKDEYGKPDLAEARRGRLTNRLRDALQQLERGTRRDPKGSDAVSIWLAPNLAANLTAAGLHTLQAVRDALAARKTSRWSEVSGVGEVWADRLLDWLQEQAITPSPAPVLPSPVPASLLVPLERFEAPFDAVLPASSANPVGHQRSSPYPANNAIGAQHDRHAVELWLEAKASNPNTLRAYRKNAERFLLWCYMERQTTFTEITVADCIHYRTWLTDLGRRTPEEWKQAGWRLPAEQWIMQPALGAESKRRRVARRDSPDWRPFEGPLKPDSVAFDLLTVRSLFEFLVRGHILNVNPWDLMGKKATSRAKLATATQQFTGRSLTLDQWKLVVDGLSADGPEFDRRLLLVLWLGFACGLRASEMLSLTLGSVVPTNEVWRLNVLGKGSKVRLVPLPSPVRLAMLAYLSSVGVSYEEMLEAALNPDSAAAGHPILRSRRGRRTKGGPVPTEPLQYTQLYDALKTHFARRAAQLEQRDPITAAKFRAASTHWLRHTCATQALKNGVALTGVQKLLGHADLSTTSTYLTELDDILAAEMESFVHRVEG